MGKLEETAVPLLLASPAVPPAGEIPSQHTLRRRRYLTASDMLRATGRY
jgi:hypothetical protein